MACGFNMDSIKSIAHAEREPGKDAWRELHNPEDHLLSVATLASRFVPGHGVQWASVRRPELGKYRLRRQKYIRLARNSGADTHIRGAADKARRSTSGTELS